MSENQTQVKNVNNISLQPPLVTKYMLKERNTPQQKPILVVEDNPVNQKVIKLQLERMGFAVDAAYNGREALAALEQNGYSLVLMDCQMPEMDGYEATGALRRAENGLTHTPVIAVTANAMQGEREKCLAAGMDDYISKPIRKDALTKILERWLKFPDEQAGGAATENSAENLKLEDLIDLDNLREVTDDNSEMTIQIVELYVQQTSEQLDGLSKAIENKNAREIYQIAHKCLGSSATCGITAMIEPLRELERMGRDEQIDGASDKLIALQQIFERLEPLLQKFLSEVKEK